MKSACVGVLSINDYLRFDFLAAVTLKITVFWFVTPYSLNF